MKALVVLLFMIVVTGFTLFSRACSGHEQQIMAMLKADALAALQGREDLSSVKVSVHQLDVILSGRVPSGMRLVVATMVRERLRAGRVINRLEEATSETQRIPTPQAAEHDVGKTFLTS